MKTNRSFPAWGLVLVCVFAGLLVSCGGASKKLGVAMPALNTHQEKSVPAEAKSSLPRSVAVLPFVNRTDSDAAFEVVRRTIFNHFASKNYHALHWKDVDARLKAAGLDDPEKLASAGAAQLASTLGTDGLLYGEITHYDKLFLGVYAQVSVGVRLRLVNREGQEIWRGEDVVRSHAGGISTTPVGLILNVLAAAYHTRDVNLYRAADELGRELLAKIPEPARLEGASPPKIMQVVHDGAGRVLRYGDTLSIAMQGEPGLHGFARIEGFKTLDLREEQPGFYTAKYNVSPSDNVSGAAVIGVLRNDSGLQSEWTAPLGLLDIDNTPPAPPAGITTATVKEGLKLAWAMSREPDVAAYEVMVSDHAQGPFAKLATVWDTSYMDAGAQMFSSRFYRIVAVDRAGNRGESATVRATRLADPRLIHAVDLPEILPARIEGIAVMRAGHQYQLSGTTELAPDAVLLVEPDVAVAAGASGSLKVFGEVQGFGTKARPIRIRGGKRTLVLASEKPVHLRGITIDGSAIAVTVTAGAPRLSGCRLIHNRFSAMEISGISRPVVEHSRLEGATSGGVLIMGKAQPRFTGNLFVDLRPFHIQSSSAYRIDARGNVWTPAATASTVLGDVDYSDVPE